MLKLIKKHKNFIKLVNDILHFSSGGYAFDVKNTFKTDMLVGSHKIRITYVVKTGIKTTKN